jgi:hypothetical protein
MIALSGAGYNSGTSRLRWFTRTLSRLPRPANPARCGLKAASDWFARILKAHFAAYLPTGPRIGSGRSFACSFPLGCFTRASFVYQEMALDVYWEVRRGREDSPIILRWQTTVNDDLLLALEALESRFANERGLKGLPAAIWKLRSTHAAMYDAYSEWRKRRDSPPPLELLATFQRIRLGIIRDVDSFVLRMHDQHRS